MTRKSRNLCFSSSAPLRSYIKELDPLRDGEKCGFEALKEEKERARKIWLREGKRAGIFRDLGDCLATIVDKVKLPPVRGVFPVQLYNCALISPSLADQMNMGTAVLAGAGVVFQYAGIQPYQIVETQVFSLTDLAAENATAQLKDLLV